MAQPTRREVAGTAAQVLYALAAMSPSNPANVKRLAMVDQFRSRTTSAVAALLIEGEAGEMTRAEVLANLTTLLAQAEAMRDRARTEAP